MLPDIGNDWKKSWHRCQLFYNYKLFIKSIFEDESKKTREKLRKEKKIKDIKRNRVVITVAKESI